MAKQLSLSNSEIQTWKRCKRKWYLSHYLEYGPQQDKAELGPRQMGTFVHLALQAWYESTHADPANPVDVAIALYAAEIEKWPTAAVELAKERDVVVAMLSGYLEYLAETGADSDLEFYATEQTVEVDSPVPGVKIRGRMDGRVVRKTDNARLFVDHKTKATIAGLSRMLPLDEQMKFYHLLEWLDAIMKTGEGPPERTDGAIYNVLRRVKRTATAKPPFYERFEVRHNEATLRSMWLRVKRVIEEIVEVRAALDAYGDHQYLVYPTPDSDCDWKCPFISVCPMMDDGSRWQDMLEEHYTHVDPYERYREEMKEAHA